MFDGKKTEVQPRPVVVLDSYGGMLRMLGRSTKANDDRHKLEHPPHNHRCDLGDKCWITENGYVSINKRDVWTPLASDFDDTTSCYEPDEDFVDVLFDVKGRI